jgi:hypothetical protein
MARSGTSTGTTDAKLWEQEQWTDPEHIRSEAKIFLIRHNTSTGLEVWEDRSGDYNGSPRAIHRCHCPQGRALPHRKLPDDFEIDANRLPITEGKVQFIRRVLGNGTTSVLNEDFDVGESFL